MVQCKQQWTQRLVEPNVDKHNTDRVFLAPSRLHCIDHALTEQPQLPGKARKGASTMLNLQIVQARYGDSLILQYGTADSPRYLLVDGGPAYVYERHLKPILQTIHGEGGALDLIVLSHVDDDHVNGLLDFLDDLLEKLDRPDSDLIAVGELWHNTFSQTIGPDAKARFDRVMEHTESLRAVTVQSDRMNRSIAQGDKLTRRAIALGLPINPSHRFGPKRMITADESTEPIPLENLTLRVVGPTQANLEELKEDWAAWLKKQEERVLTRDLQAAEEAARSLDDSVPNLSSIMLLAEADGRTLLLTGDGRSDHLIQGLEQADRLDRDGRLHVDVLKVPHHGSARNVSKAFFRTITADTYVLCADGRHDNPDLSTLTWMVEAAHEQDRHIDIFATNETNSTRQLIEDYPPCEYGYHLTMMAPGQHAVVLELASGPTRARPGGRSEFQT